MLFVQTLREVEAEHFDGMILEGPENVKQAFQWLVSQQEELKRLIFISFWSLLSFNISGCQDMSIIFFFFQIIASTNFLISIFSFYNQFLFGALVFLDDNPVILNLELLRVFQSNKECFMLIPKMNGCCS